MILFFFFKVIKIIYKYVFVCFSFIIYIYGKIYLLIFYQEFEGFFFILSVIFANAQCYKVPMKILQPGTITAFIGEEYLTLTLLRKMNTFCSMITSGKEGLLSFFFAGLG